MHKEIFKKTLTSFIIIQNAIAFGLTFLPLIRVTRFESICAAHGIVLAAEELRRVHTSAHTKGGLVSVPDDLDMDHTQHFKGSARAEDHQTALQFL